MPLQTYNFRLVSPSVPERTEAIKPLIHHLVMGHFQEGRGYATWRAHGTTDWLLIATLSGSGRFGYGGGESRTVPGELVLLPPGVLHDYSVAPPSTSWELLWAHFHPHPHWLEWLDWPQIAPGLLQLVLNDSPVRAEILTKLHEALRHTTSAERRREEFAMNSLEAALLLCDTVNPRQGQPVIDSRVRAAMDYLCRNYTHNLSLDQLGAVVGPLRLPPRPSLPQAGRPDSRPVPGAPAPRTRLPTPPVQRPPHPLHRRRTRLREPLLLHPALQTPSSAKAPETTAKPTPPPPLRPAR